MEATRLKKPFGRLRILKRVPPRQALCRCECGKKVTVYLTNLYAGSTQSCGCLGRERRLAAVKVSSTKHGMHGTPEYQAWQSMLNRCLNKKGKDYHRYGGRGISVDLRWLEFKSFFEDMGRRPVGYSLERKDNNLGYSKENCVWTTRRAQTRNRRNSVHVRYKGRTRLFAELCEERGVPYSRAYNRLARGWPVERAVS